MLIRFRVSNFLSFKDEVEVSMIPGKARKHPNHIVSTGAGRNDLSLLRASVFYGANASGKSNLIKALSFAKFLVENGVDAKSSIPVKKFKLDRSCSDLPSKFEFEIRVGDVNYLYGFEVNPEAVVSEWLFLLRRTAPIKIFERKLLPENETAVEFGKIPYKSEEDRANLKFVARGTRPNQLFLRESIDRNVKYFEQVYNWFAKTLVIIFPHTRGEVEFDATKHSSSQMTNYLSQFGTGVCGFGLQSTLTDGEIPKALLDDLGTDMEKGGAIVLIDPNAQRYLIKKEDTGDLSISKLLLKHKNIRTGEDVLFEAKEESDGTMRLMDLVGILSKDTEGNHVYVIDELDRSLHPNLCLELMRQFLARDGKDQLLVTTHESSLLNLDVLRRDEIWFTEKNAEGASTAYSLEEFAPRYDKDVQKGYLLGRFGAIPLLDKKFR